MEILKFLAENWLAIMLIISLGLFGIGILREFRRRPIDEQKQTVQEWLVWAVAWAEKALGGGEGERKLKLVYGWFQKRFPSMAMLIDFDEFKGMVDFALRQLQDFFEDDNILDMLVKEAVKDETV